MPSSGNIPGGEASPRDHLSFEETSTPRSRSKIPPKSRSKDLDLQRLYLPENMYDLEVDTNIQKRFEWLEELQFIFETYPESINTDEKKIEVALMKMEPDCRMRWYNHLKGMDPEERLEMEQSWNKFKKWTRDLLQNKATSASNLIRRVTYARQKPGQSPDDLDTYLTSLEEALEDNFPGDPEARRALEFFARLTPDLCRCIDEHVAIMPKTRSEMITVATQYWNLLTSRHPKRKNEETNKEPSKRPRYSHKSSSSYWKYRHKGNKENSQG